MHMQTKFYSICYLCITDKDRDFINAKKILVNYLNKEQLRDLFRELGLADRILQNGFEVHAINQYADSLLRAWINEEDYVPTGGTTWENLKTALQSIGCGGAANQI